MSFAVQFLGQLLFHRAGFYLHLSTFKGACVSGFRHLHGGRNKYQLQKHLRTGSCSWLSKLLYVFHIAVYMIRSVSQLSTYVAFVCICYTYMYMYMYMHTKIPETLLYLSRPYASGFQR